ncbi:MAG: response regulator [Puniceicoccaceae bacterium]
MNTTHITGTGSVLIVDDETLFRNRLATALERRGFVARVAGSVAEARELLRMQSIPEFALVDLHMPGESGMVLVSELCAMAANVRVVVLTAYGSIANAVEAVRLGAVDYLTKPVDADQITNALLGCRKDWNPAAIPEHPITLEQMEWEHIQRVMREHDGNLSATARSLGLHRRSLQRKLAKWSPWTSRKSDTPES